MCLVTFAKDVHPDYPLIFIMNRDELYERTASPIHRWVTDPNVIAGVDLEEFGTWLGYTLNGKFIAVLNHPFTNWIPKLSEPRSRGKLLRDYLTKDISLIEFEQQLTKTRQDYNGYHLLYGTFNQLNYYSNINDTFEKIENGIHTLSNTFDDLSMHRKNYSCELLDTYIKNHRNELSLDGMIQLMQNKEPSEVMEEFPAELSIATAKQGSSIFIKGEEFGTVSTTAILLDKDGNIQVKEAKYNQEKITEITEIEHKLKL